MQRSMTTNALLIVDTQIDFCPGGGFPVPEGDQIVLPLNKMLAFARTDGWKIVASRDWHSEKLFSEDGCSRHCVQGSDGARLHPSLNVNSDITIISKGSSDLSEKHYSAFNGDNVLLDELLKSEGVNSVYIGGLALDYCVKYTAIDSVKRGYKTTVFLDATRAVKNDPTSVNSVVDNMKKKGVSFTTVKDFLRKAS